MSSKLVRPVLAHAQFFGLTQHRSESAGFTIALMNADPWRDVTRHTHETAHWILLLEGPYITSARHAPALCVRPTLVYNPPGTTHRDRFSQINGRFRGRFLSIAIASQRMAEIAEELGVSDEAILVEDVRMMELASRLAGECARWDDASPLSAESLCLELMTGVSRRPTPNERATPGWLRTARELLQDRCAESPTVADIALETGVHPVYLARTFRRFFGCSPGDFLRRCRLERATALLGATSQSLSDVAIASGYCDQSHLTRTVRRAYGMTPAQFRQAAALAGSEH